MLLTLASRESLVFESRLRVDQRARFVFFRPTSLQFFEFLSLSLRIVVLDHTLDPLRVPARGLDIGIGQLSVYRGVVFPLPTHSSC